MTWKRFATLAGVLALSACGATAPTASGTSTAPAAAPSTAPATAPAAAGSAVHLSDFKIVPSTLSATAGSVSFAVTNDGPTPHNLAIRDSSGKVLGTTKDLKPGESGTLTVTLAAGTYTAFCSLAGHESLGMKDTLTVS